MTNHNDLVDFSKKIRIETLKQIGKRGFGHVGGCMSIVETLAVLYGGVMNIDPMNPKDEDRDWLVVSKGHAGPAVYSTLALKGYFDIQMLRTLNIGGTLLPSHCDKNKTPGIDMTTGSLGQGISAAIGVALGYRIKKTNNWIYLILGDGESQEGQVWEGALFAAHFKVDHLIALLDRNKQQIDGYTKDVMDLGDLHKKFEDFGWHVQTVDGHDVKAIEAAVYIAKKATGKPSMIVLETEKGKGCSFAEGILDNHHMCVTNDQIEESLKLLECD